MGKKKTATGLGKSLIKSRFGKHNRADGDSFLHTSELNDGYEWNRLNLQSVTEQNNLEEFLATAELAGTEFTAEKLNVKFISKESSGLPHGEELARIAGLHRQHENMLRIPRRPPWTAEMSASELDLNERGAFLEWRRSLAALQEVEGLVMTPYEKNLDFWRQLWRVIERSDVVVQIVDARNPLLFFCGDLESYIQEVDDSKMCVVLINKADYLDTYQRNPLHVLFFCDDLESYIQEVDDSTMCVVLINKADYLDTYQRAAWADYFTSRGVRVAFWSAVLETERQEEAQKAEKLLQEDMLADDNVDDSSDEDEDDDEEDDVDMQEGEDASTEKTDKTVTDTDKCTDEHMVEESATSGDCDKSVENVSSKEAVSNKAKQTDTDTAEVVAETSKHTDTVGLADNENMDSCGACGMADTETTGGDSGGSVAAGAGGSGKIVNTGHIHTGPELVEFLRSLHSGKKVQEGRTTVGMVGYPNVGKSSTINAILKMKKVPVSATPGRTKHFQTLYVDAGLMLCDCPGLVFPSFVTTKADLVVNGILPIDQMRDCLPPSALICQRMPRRVLEKIYGIMLPKPAEGEDADRDPTAHELLNTYGAMRGYMTARGQPDGPRSSRYILKDYVNGKLLYCHAPPGADPTGFNNFGLDDTTQAGDLEETGQQAASSKSDTTVSSKVDADFFRKEFSKVHERTARSGGNSVDTGSGSGGGKERQEKSWKKHNNRNKKEKMKRVYGYLDN